ncbi:MAG: AcrB/AcrD/AcrF family protein [Planctomycetota bacterium]|nr:MAG: AcrB/AcrD/AcrF family protein [Planctomycetota bacterium]
MEETRKQAGGFLAGVVARFLEGRNALLLLLLALVLGVAAVLGTPREEEPQIVVPLADVFVEVPGYSAKEVERLVATPLERLLWQLDGVEYVYSMSSRDRAIVTVRFFVGQDREDSIIKLRNRIESHLDQVPSIVQGWLVRPIEIDDVPIVTLTLYGPEYDQYDLRRVAEEMKARLDSLPELSRTGIYGGAPREIRIELDRERMQGRDLTLWEVQQALTASKVQAALGSFQRLNEQVEVATGSGFRSLDELRELVVATRDDLPVHLREIAEIQDGPAELESYTRMTWGGASERAGHSLPAVTLAISKQKGSDATRVAERVLSEARRLQEEVLPHGVEMEVTRNYGATADRKVDDLLSSIGFALISVVILLLFTLGWREALVVAVAVPVSFSLALFVNWMFGYTINRVTLFALILSLGLVVDDPIANVDNIQRHIRSKPGRPRRAVLDAVREVLPPVIMSTLTIIVSFLPMFFITGMMGPYMAPMAANVPLAVSASTLAALSVVPWLAFVLLKPKKKPGSEVETEEVLEDALSEPQAPKGFGRIYRWLAGPWIASGKRAWLLLFTVLVMFLASGSLVLLGKVPLKMLPFDNKDELQLVLDLPEGNTLEQSDAVVRNFERFLAARPEVLSCQSYVGLASPMDFNGLVRHSYLRQAPHLADIRIKLLPKEQRSQQSHALALAMRRDLEALAEENGAVLQIVEVPPGPPVLSTVVAEVRGAEDTPYQALVDAGFALKERMAEEPGLTDLDVMAAAPQQRLHFRLDRRQAALHGVDESQVAGILGLALGEVPAATPLHLRLPNERQPLPVRIRLPRGQRTGAEQLALLAARTSDGRLMALQEVGEFESEAMDTVYYHKNLRPVVYVTGEMAGRAPAEAILSLQASLREKPMPPAIEVDWAGEGEWEITIRVFRDLGLAFGAALVFIYLLLTVETKSLALPLLVMMAIPLTAIGILPGFWLLNHFFAGEVGGYTDSVFFTATAMIGMIALGGIVVRNSLVLLEFITSGLQRGLGLREAILQSGAVRMRPILLTAGTTALGAWPITLDPIFSGLAWSLIFGLLASTLFSLIVVPALFYLLNRKRFPA